ncbi:MAG: alpha/beta fold hydrolase, partial [Rhodanobacteraceae bacterium]
MTRRTGWRIALVLLAIAVLAGRHWLWPSEDSRAAGASGKGAAIAQTHGERGFTLGTLAFAPCELDQRNSAATTAAYCAPFQVPENWEKPDGRKIGLKLAIVRSDAQVAERDLVVLLAGGPGQAATEVYPRAAAGFAPMLRHRNLLLLDQRGTGDSHPLRCAQDPTDFDSAAVNEVDFAKVRELTQACLADVAKDADPAQYTTSAAVRDLEAVRQALGAPEFDLVGVSYGTRVAQQYLRRYPDGVRSLVLDSAVPNPLVLGSEFAINLDASLESQFSLCVFTPACANAFGDPYASLYRLRDKLAAAPVQVEMRHPRTYERSEQPLNEFTLATLVRLFAYSAET